MFKPLRTQSNAAMVTAKRGKQHCPAAFSICLLGGKLHESAVQPTWFQLRVKVRFQFREGDGKSEMAIRMLNRPGTF